jgi:hypothetical protein
MRIAGPGFFLAERREQEEVHEKRRERRTRPH